MIDIVARQKINYDHGCYKSDILDIKSLNKILFRKTEPVSIPLGGHVNHPTPRRKLLALTP